MKISLASMECGDWEKLYVDGILVAENHSLDLVGVLELLSKKLEFDFERNEISCQECDEDC